LCATAKMRADVADGSEAVILARSPDVCSFPDSGEKADILQPLRSCKTDFFVAVFLL
jgi:hypothetical protein